MRRKKRHINQIKTNTTSLWNTTGYYGPDKDFNDYFWTYGPRNFLAKEKPGKNKKHCLWNTPGFLRTHFSIKQLNHLTCNLIPSLNLNSRQGSVFGEFEKQKQFTNSKISQQ